MYFAFSSHSQRLLTWYDGLIPDNEIWLKVGGDKGGNSFKMSFQIVNVNKPNSWRTLSSLLAMKEPIPL